MNTHPTTADVKAAEKQRSCFTPAMMEAIYAAWHGSGVDVAGGNWERFVGMLPRSGANPKHFAVGQSVTYGGFRGVIVRHYSKGMWEVRLPSGVGCFSGADLIPV